MTGDQRRNIFAVFILMFGMALSIGLAWTIEQWRAESRGAVELRAAEARANRIARALQADTSHLEAVGALLSQVDRADAEFFTDVVKNISSDDTLGAVSWAPEVTRTSLPAFLLTHKLFQSREDELKASLEEKERLLPIALRAGSSSTVQLGIELTEHETFAPALETTLRTASLTPVILNDTSNPGNVFLNLLVPVIINDGAGLGILLGEISFAELTASTATQADSEFAVRLYDHYPVRSQATPLWEGPKFRESSFQGHQVLAVPIQLGEHQWAVDIHSTRIPPGIDTTSLLVGVLGLFGTLFVAGYSRRLGQQADQQLFRAQESVHSLRLKDEELKSALRLLGRAEENYSDLFEKSQALIWTQDEEGVIQSLNPASADSLGYQLAEMSGRSLKDFIIPTERHTFPSYLERCNTQDASKGLLKLYTKNGATRFWMYQSSVSKEGDLVAVRCHALDVTESQQAERELERLSRRNELILESVGEGIYGINLAGECTFVNPAALEQTGHSRAELMSAAKTMHEILQPEKVDGSEYPWEESTSFDTLNDGEVRRVSNEYMWRKDGTRFPVDFVVTPIVEDDSRILGAVVTFQDITQRKAVEQMKNEFIAIVSHELRTPLTSIRGSLGLLASGLLKKFPDKADKMLKIAVENTDRLVRLINDILDIERLESGKVTLEQGEHELGSLMGKATDTMQAMAGDNKVKLELEAIDRKVWVDPDRFIQVLTNLCSNAIKFSKENGVVKVFAEDVEPGWVRVSVKDSGRGVPKDKLKKIFERFGQVDASDSREKGGTGLGLPICRTIVEQHGGQIWVESVEGKGSTFCFTLPTEAPAEASVEESED